jgi:hypothetical protein
MASRCTLHINKLETFKTWLLKNNIQFRPGKGDFQVLQVETSKNGFQCIYFRHEMPEHYTVQDKLMPLVKRFIRETRTRLPVGDNTSNSDQVLIQEASTHQ